MADAFFGFDTNAEQVAGRIEQAMTQIARSLHGASMGEGIAVPTNFFDQIVRQAQEAGQRARRELEEAFAILRTPEGAAAVRADPGGIRHYMDDSMRQVGTNMFNSMRLSIDETLRQLDPRARFQLLETGELNRALADVRTVTENMMRDNYTDLRRQLDTSVQRGTRATPNLDEMIENIRMVPGQILAAEEDRLARIYSTLRDEEGRALRDETTGRLQWDTDEAGRPIPITAAGEVGAAQQAVAQQIAAGRRQTAEELRKAKEEADALAQRLRAEGIARTTGLLADPEFGRIGRSQYYGRGVTGEQGVGEYYRLSTMQGAQVFERIDDNIDRQADYARARQAHYDELARAEMSASEQSRLLREQQRRAGFVGGVGQGLFGRGFGSDDVGGLDPQAALTNIGQTVGSAVRYSVAYGGFYELIQVSQAIVDSFVDFQDSMTDYEVAVGDSSVVTEGLVGDMQELSRVVGENVGASFDAAARTVRAFGDLGSMTAEVLNEIGVAGAEASQMLSVITGEAQTKVTGDIVSVGTAFGMRPEELQRIPNIVAAAKRVGGDPAQITQGLSNIAVAAQEAGFSLEETANMISLVQARTDQSGQAVATRLSRVFSIISGTTGQRLAEQITRMQPDTPVDTEATVRDQIQQIARAYAQAGPELQGLIRSQLGGTSNVRELLPLLTEFPRLMEAVRFTLANPDAGFDEYERKINNFVGTLNKIKGSLQNIAVDMVKADIFAPIAAGLIVLEKTLDAIDRLLTAYNQLTSLVDLPGPVGAIATGAAEIGLGAMAWNRLRRSSFVGEVAEGSGLAAATARRVAVENTATAATARRAGVENAAAAAETRLAASSNAAAGSLTRIALMSATPAGLVAGGGNLAKRGLGAVGGFLGAHPILTALGVGLAGYTFASNVQNDREALERIRSRSTRAFGSGDLTPEDMRDTAQLLRTERARIDSEISGLSGLFSQGQAEAQQRMLNERAQVLDSWARVTEEEQARINQEGEYARALNDVSIMGIDAVHTTEDLAEGLERLRQSGAGAKSRLDALIETLTNPASETAGASISPRTYTMGLAKRLFGGITADTLPGGALEYTTTDARSGLQTTNRRAVGPERIFEQMIEDGRLGKAAITRAQRAMQETIQSFNLEPGEIPTARQLQQVVRAGIGAVDFSGLGIDPQDLARFKNRVTQRVLNTTRGYKELLEGIEAEPGPLSVDDIDSIVQEAENYAGEVSAYDGFGRMQIAGYRKAIAAIRQGRGPDNMEYANDQLRTLRHAMREVMVNRTLSLMRAAESQIDPDNFAAIRANRVKHLERALRQAGNDTQLLLTVMESADRQSLNIARESIVRALRVAQQAMQASQAVAELINNSGLPQAMDALGGLFSGGLTLMDDKTPGANNRRARGRVERLKQKVADFDEALTLLEIPGSVREGGSAAQERETLTKAQRAAMRAAATIAPDNEIAQARNAIQSARADMAAAKGKGEEYFDALGRLTQAQFDLSEALGSRREARRLAGIASDDEVGLAAAEVDAARAALNRATPGTRAYWEALRRLQDGQRNFARLQAEEAAAFALAAVDPDDAAGRAKVELDNAMQVLGTITPGTKAYADQLGQIAQLRDAYQDSVVAEANAFQSAEASRVGGDIASARAQIDGAVRGMKVTAKDTEEYANLLGQYYEGQRALRDAISAHEFVLMQLSGDMTDPVEQARDTLKDVRNRLQKAIAAGQAPDVIDALKLEEEQAQHARERSAFDQRMQDAQTANELGRMSFQAYMNYLEREHDRLSSIKNRTRQQQDMLNEVDMAIKNAQQTFEGQFNLGDIRLPTPYQVRRYIEAKTEAAANPERFMADNARRMVAQQGPVMANSNNSSVTNNINIYDDPERTRRVVQDVVGRAARTRTTQPRRR